MQKVLVTGGAGFIGSHLVDYLLLKGYDVVVLDNFSQGNKLSETAKKSVRLINGDIRDYSTVQNAVKDCLFIYHLAAILGVDVVAGNHVNTMEIETVGMQNIALAIKGKPIYNIVYASTSGIYGKSAFDMSVNEDFKVDPRTSYSIAKRYNEIYLKSLLAEQNISSVSIRYFNVYGPRQDERMVIPRFIDQARKNDPITVYGDGYQTRDFTYIDDAIKLTVELGESVVNGAEIINLCGDNEKPIVEIAHLIKNKLHSQSEIRFKDIPKNRKEFEVRRRTGNTSKLQGYLGKQSFTPVEVGLSNILNESHLG